jgi:hypothetical protein
VSVHSGFRFGKEIVHNSPLMARFPTFSTLLCAAAQYRATRCATVEYQIREDGSISDKPVITSEDCGSGKR